MGNSSRWRDCSHNWRPSRGLSPLVVAWRFRPVLVIDYQGDNRIDEDRYIWIRVRIRNTGHRRATDCQAFITAIFELRADGSLHPVTTDSKRLQWAGGSMDTRAVPVGVEFYVDLLKVLKDMAGFGIIHDVFPSQQDLQNYSGTYQFHLMVSGDNAAPARCRINVEYKRDWHTLRAWSG
jgi:hypothetical protein